jgi:uncharacterized membrane protein (DUF106 family)
MGLLNNLLSGKGSDLVNSIGSVLDNVVTSKEEKMQLENEIKKAEFEFHTEMRRLDVTEKENVLKDIDSARTRETAVQTSEHSTTLSKNVSPMLAILTVFLTFFLFLLLIFRNDLLKQEMKDVVIYILGVMSAILSQIFSYYFGSSQSSANKNKMIQELQAKQQ